MKVYWGEMEIWLHIFLILVLGEGRPVSLWIADRLGATGHLIGVQEGNNLLPVPGVNSPFAFEPVM
jgi:hypothetical protein